MPPDEAFESYSVIAFSEVGMRRAQLEGDGKCGIIDFDLWVDEKRSDLTMTAKVHGRDGEIWLSFYDAHIH